MTRKLLLTVATFALTSILAMSQLNRLNLEENLKNSFSATVEQQSGVIINNNPMQKAPAADTQIFFEDFEDFNTTTMLPAGWETTDNLSGAMSVSNIYESTRGSIAAFSGDYALSSMYDDEKARDGWAFAPALELEAGTTYHFGVYALCMGYQSLVDEWEMTIGNAKTPEAQTNVIMDYTGDNAITNSKWELCTGTFTPETSGTYYLAIHHCTQQIGVNIVMWDYLQVDSDHVKILPKGVLFSKGGLWSLDGHTQDEEGNVLPYRAYLSDGDQMQYGCAGSNIETLMWDFGPYATADNVEGAQPIVTYNFPENEDQFYNDVVLVMMNGDGEAYAMREFFIDRIGNNSTFTDFVSNIRPEDGFYKYTSGSNYDAVSGLNTGYTRMAERYILPDDVTVSVPGGYLIPVHYNMSVINRNKEFTIRVLSADENDMPGEAVFSKNFKFSEVFGTQSFEYTMLAIFDFGEDVKVTGTFFIEFEFPSLSISSNNTLFLATSSARPFANDHSSFYYNEMATQGTIAGWNSSTQMFGAGVSTAIYPLVTFQDKAGVDAPQHVSECTVFANGRDINVVNAQAGSSIVVTDLAGRIVLQATADDFKTVINSELNAGIYIVTVNGTSTKIAIR